MRSYITIIRSLLVLGVLLTHGSLQAKENRLALVIGNSDYEESPLRNPINDATDMAEVLEGLGFEVILRNDANRREMARAIRDFGRELKKKRGVGLFYYAGHGLQIENRNYLIPIGTPLEEEDEVPFESIDVGSVLAKMESAGNALNLMILDACRNNPFPSQFRSSSRGLARVEAPVGSLVVYSTAPGNIAADGEGRNGVFTGQLLKQLKTPGLSLTQTIRRTRAAVVSETSGRQVPWESSSLLKDYYFSPPEPATDSQTTKPASDATLTKRSDSQDTSALTAGTGASEKTTQSAAAVELQAFAPEVIFWNSVEAGSSQGEYEAYLQRYPEGLFTELAKLRLATLASAAPQTTTATEVEPPATAASVAPTPPPIEEAITLEDPLSASDANATDTQNDSEIPWPEPKVVGKNPEFKPGDVASTDSDQPIQLARNSITSDAETKPADGFKDPTDSFLSKLTVSVIPEDARIRIMNIVEKYKPGISLDRSRSYDVYVTRPGYDSYRDNITLDQSEQELSIVLREQNLVAPRTVPLAGGSFTMGCSKGDSLCKSYEKPAHSVTVSAYAMTKTEITVSQFGRFVDATGYVTDAEKNAGGNKGCFVWSDGGGISRSSARWGWKAGTNWRNPGYKQKGNFPVTCVSWSDAVAYAEWLSGKTNQRYSLPTEAQWEFAARAGSTARYLSSNNSASLCTHANVADRSLSPTGSKWSERVACTDNYWFSAPVSSFKPNSAGLHDMQGNVWEWVDDVWASTFKNTPRNGLANRSGDSKSRVLRGGAWDGDEKLVRISNRSKADISNRAAMTGFRLVVR